MKPYLVKWDETYRRQGLVVLDIDNGAIDSMQAVRGSVQEGRLDFPVAWDEGGKTCRAYGVRGYPHAFLIGADGKVVWDGFPFKEPIEKREEQIRQELTKVTPEEIRKIE